MPGRLAVTRAAYHRAMIGTGADEEVGRYAPQRDVSDVAPRRGYVAQRCALRVQYELFPPPGAEPSPPADVEQLRAEARAAFEAEVLAAVGAQHPDALVVDQGRPPALHEAETLLAMGEGVPVVIGGRLPTDVLGRREGRPHVLARGERRPDGAWAYHPVEVRNHKTIDVGESKGPALGALVSPLAAPWLAAAAPAEDGTTRSHQGDRFGLAHLHRMLEQTPHGSADAVGAVIGTERRLVWHRLDVPVAQHRWDRRHRTTETTLARYDLEFSFRLDVLAAAAGDPIVDPVAVGECSTCPWRTHCWPRIEAADSTSLLPGFGYRQWYNLTRQGITTRAQLAALDLRTALVRDAFEGIGDLAAVVARAATSEPDAPAVDVLGIADRPRPGHADVGPDLDAGPTAEVLRQVTALAAHGITTAADLLTLDLTVVALADQPIRRLAEAIGGARAQATGRPQLRHGVERLEVPSADVEIDIDMESALDGTAYLWGALVDGTYHAVRSWDTPTAEAEAVVFVAFWDWLTAQRRAARVQGRSVAIYCWFKGAESGALRRGAQAASVDT